MADAIWYYTQGGQQVGPVTVDQLRQMMGTGQLGSGDLVWRDGMAQWAPASTVPELGTRGPAPVQPLAYGNYAPVAGAPIPVGTIPNYLVQSILVTVLCCWPLGIPAIVNAAAVNGKLALGDYQGAVEASRRAKMWCFWALGLGLGAQIVGVTLVLLSASMQ